MRPRIVEENIAPRSSFRERQVRVVLRQALHRLSQCGVVGWCIALKGGVCFREGIIVNKLNSTLNLHAVHDREEKEKKDEPDTRARGTRDIGHSAGALLLPAGEEGTGLHTSRGSAPAGRQIGNNTSREKDITL